MNPIRSLWNPLTRSGTVPSLAPVAAPLRVLPLALLLVAFALNALAVTQVIPPNPIGGRQAKVDNVTLATGGYNYRFAGWSVRFQQIGNQRLASYVEEGVFDSKQQPILAGLWSFGLADSGEGYAYQSPSVTVLSATGGGAWIGANGVSGVPGFTGLEYIHLYDLGGLYSDDTTIVVAPPHLHDLASGLNNPEVDVIQLQAGRYFENAVIDRDLTIRGEGIGRTIVSGGLLGSVFKILPGRRVTLEDMTIIDGLAPSGGGIFNDGDLEVVRCEIKDCRAYGYLSGEGGGIFNRGRATLLVRDSILQDNIAARDGGGIASSGANFSSLPKSGGNGYATNTYSGVLGDMASLQAPSDLSDTNLVQELQDQWASKNASRQSEIGNPRQHYTDLLFDPFRNLTGWTAFGSPVCVISNTVIRGNRVGNASAVARLSTPFGDTRLPRAVVFGGGVHSDLGLLKLMDCDVTDNRAESDLASMGGGISAMLGALEVSNTKVNGNRVEASTILAMGGALYNFGCYARVQDAELKGNKAKALFLSSGGAMKNTLGSFTELTRCELNGNSSGGGGAVANDYYGILQLNDCSLMNNSVSGIISASGGGLRNDEGGQAVLTGCTISGNSAKGKAKGGGLYNQADLTTVGSVPVIFASTLTLRNCTISSNVVDGKGIFDIPLLAFGGGVFNGASRKGIANTYLADCTLFQNRAFNGLTHHGGGLYSTALSDPKLSTNPTNNLPGLATVELANTLIAQNAPEDVDNAIFTGTTFIVSLGYNMDSDGTAASATLLSDVLLPGDAGFKTYGGPILGPLQFNGGATLTHALLPGTPAIDSGAPNGYFDPNFSLPADQRGVDRALGGRRDIGAFESVSPLARGETYETLEDKPLVVSPHGLLANDFASGPSIASATATSNGSLNVMADGSFEYRPNTNFTGSDSFVYQVADLQGGVSAPVTNTIVVRPRLDWLSVDPAPGSTAERYTDITLTFDEPVTSQAITRHVLLSGSVSGAHGFTVTTSGNVAVLNPRVDFTVGEQVTVTVPESLRSAAGSPLYPGAAITFSIFPNRPPNGRPDTFGMTEDGVLSIGLNGVLANDDDPDGDIPKLLPNSIVTGSLYQLSLDYRSWLETLDYDPFLYVGVYPSGSWALPAPSRTLNGTLLLSTNGTFTYRPNTNFAGIDTFQYRLTDGSLVTSNILVSIYVTNVNDAPVAFEDVYASGQFTATASEGVLRNDVDVDGNVLTAQLVTPPAYGSIVLNPNGSFAYSPGPGYPGSDVFTYRAFDGAAASLPVRVKLGNARPIAADDSNYAPVAGAPFRVGDPALGVLGNDRDADGDPLTAVVVNGPSHGTLILRADGTFDYTPNAGYSGYDSFTYLAQDGRQSSLPARVKLGNSDPNAVPDSGYSVLSGQSLTIAASSGVLSNDTDAESDPLKAVLVTGPIHGSLVLQTNGAFVYTPQPGYSGADTFTYTANDPLTASTPATVTIRVQDYVRVLSYSPARNSAAGSSNGILQLTFNAPINPASLTGRINVQGSFSGRHAFTTTLVGSQLTLRSTTGFAPGEIVHVTLRAGIEGTGYFTLDRNIVWQYAIQAPRGGAFFTRASYSTNAPMPVSVALGDLNGDGRIDAFMANQNASPRVYFNNGDSTFTGRDETLGLSWGFMQKANGVVADFDGNGTLDLAGTTGYGQVNVGLNNGAGTFTPVSLPFVIPYGASFLAAGDFDGDGDVDLLGLSLKDAWVWLNDGTGHFTMGTPVNVYERNVTNFPQSIDVGDVDGDGDLDVYVGGFAGDRLLLNSGTGEFTLSPATLDAGSNTAVRLVDVDGDEDLDLLIGPSMTRAGTVWLNDGAGHFDRFGYDFAGNLAYEVAVGDLDGDGDFDTFHRSGGTTISLNDGSGRLVTTGQILPGVTGLGIALADLDGDGDLDAFNINQPQGSATATWEVWYNQTRALVRDDLYAANGSSPIIKAAATGVLANDVPGDGGPISAQLVSQPLHGSVVMNADGSFTYTPGGTFVGTDVFTYRGADNLFTSGVVRVKIGNTAPVALNDLGYIALSDAALKVSAPGVLANDQDGEGDALKALLATQPTHGTVTLADDGSFVYTATQGYSGPDAFAYQVTDGYATSAVATVSLDVRSRLRVASLSPSANETRARADADIVIQFNRALNPGSVNGNVYVAGQFTGPRAVAATVESNTLRLNPASDFKPGEGVTVTLTAGLEGINGERQETPTQYSFVIEAPFARGVFTDSGERLGTNTTATIVLGDFDGDGDLDAITGHPPLFMPGGVVAPGSAALRLWLNDGTGQLADSGERIGDFPTSFLSAADLDNDGDLDLVADEYIWINNGHGQFAAGQVLTAGSGSSVVDVNMDGHPDVIITSSGGFEVWLNDGTGHFTVNPSSVADLNFVSLRLRAVAAGDLNGDGSPDLLGIRTFDTDQARVWLNDGRGVFREGKAFGGGGNAVALGDLDGDGDLDAFIPRTSSAFAGSGPYLWFNQGDGTFVDGGMTYGPSFVNAARLGDADGDGDLDIFVVQEAYTTSLNTSTVLLNDGHGGFAPSGIVFGDSSTNPTNSSLGLVINRSLAVGDLNGDGAPDVFVGVQRPGADQIWLNGATMAPIEGDASWVINDNAAVAPFSSILLRSPDPITLSLKLDDNAKGGFTASSLAAGGFTIQADGTIARASGPASDALAALRQLVFVPVANRVPVGSDETTTFTLVATGSSGSRTDSNTTVRAISVSDIPVARNDQGVGFAGPANAAFITGSVLSNDSSADPGVTLSVLSVDTRATLGAVSHLGGGRFQYNPNGRFTALGLGATATDSFDYVLTDGHGNSATATVTVLINGINEAPRAGDDMLLIHRNAGQVILTSQLIANDTDPDSGDAAGLTISSVDTSGTLGIVQFDPAGGVAYRPGTAFNDLADGAVGVDSFGYTLRDAQGATASARVTVRILAIDQPPVVSPDWVTVLERAPATNLTAVLLSNDTDPDSVSAPFVITSVDTNSTVGGVTLQNGVLSYDPAGRFQALAVGESATDSFRYSVQSATMSTVARTPVRVETLRKDAFVPVQIEVHPGGTLDLTVDGRVIHADLPLPGFTLLANSRFGFGANAGGGGGTHDIDNLTLAVIPDPGSGPVTYAFDTGVPNGTTLLGSASVENGVLRLTPPGAAPLGSVILPDRTSSNRIAGFSASFQMRMSSAPGEGCSFVWGSAMPAGPFGEEGAGYGLVVSFDTADNGNGEGPAIDIKWRTPRSDGLVTVNIVGQNDAPIAVPDHIVLEEGGPAADLTAELLANDRDPDASESTTLRLATVETNGVPGTFIFSNGSLRFQPPASLGIGREQVTNFTFQYTVEDVHGARSSNALVTLYFVGRNTAPIAVADAVSVGEDAGVTDLTALLLANDYDADAGETATLTITSIDAPGVLGNLTLAGGVVTYNPGGLFNALPAGSNSIQTFSYRVQDVNGASSSAQVTLTVQGGNDRPTAASDAFEVIETSAATNITALLLANDFDPDAGESGRLTLSGLELSGTVGAVSISGGNVTYSPNGRFDALKPGQNTNDFFRYIIIDPQGARATGSVAVVIRGVNTTPNLANDRPTQTVQYSDPIAPVAVTATDVDSAGSTLVAGTRWQRDGGAFTAGLPLGLTFTPSATLGGSSTWTIAGRALVAPGTYAVEVAVVDDFAAAVTNVVRIVVVPEEARTTYTGASFASTTSPDSDRATVTLAATIQDISAVLGDAARDSFPGDVRNARVSFINRDNNTIIASNLVVGLVDPNDPKTGSVAYNWNVSVGTANAQSFTVGVRVQGFYTRDESVENTVVTVIRPLASDFVTGGGHLVLSRSSGLVPGSAGSKANFGFNVKFKSGSSSLQGSLNLIVRNAGRVYQIESSAMTSLSASGKRATFNCRGTIEDITDERMPVAVDTNATLQVKMTDNGEPGSTDTLAVTVWNRNGGVCFASAWDGARTVEQGIAGGNLVVRSSSTDTRVALADGLSSEDSSPVLHIAPVPSAPDDLVNAESLSFPQWLMLRFIARPEADYAIETSADLSSWSHLTSVMSYDREIVFYDQKSAEAGPRFYRVRYLGGETERYDPAPRLGAAGR